MNTLPQTWQWQGYNICYQQCGTGEPAVILIHGFGASWGHWRKTLPVLGQTMRVYAIDLIGFGASAKPHPSQLNYTFETWAQQIADFCQEIVQTPVFLIGNSIGCIVAMQTAVTYPDWVRGVATLNCSLRMLHERKRHEIPWHQQLSTPILQNLLRQPWFGYRFFHFMARPQFVRQALLQAYHRPEAVTDELLTLLMKPAADEGAADVFIAFTTYSQGPLPEDLYPIMPCPTLILWGTEDPWEKFEWGQKFADLPTVEKFIPLPGVGHCPQDEAPELVNPILQEWIVSHS
ncbi:alpha/beta fold hydrolase [Spirulina subsalsa FACHB-351]|uniref:Alpha/beta fold hydrolase n=1 Tax=Spirulina subsalsa FACHB-351 TaxID=234711 RepID=A0ABT3KZR8_9CYAN|nr:alpha/beta fold hydrolase [Spirulina subsalsa]MCW6034751.1 alpha/beta fold hydrolase [Spirulina subsalsa FACHB-351]